MQEEEGAQLEDLCFARLNVLNAGTNGANAAISSRKYISATVDEGTSGGGVRGVKIDA
jgi:hypothetical protein